MIIESWVYRAMPGRLPDLLSRFETATLRIFERHGFKPLGFFTTLVGQSHQELTYMLMWSSIAEREQCWATFLVDPEWRAIRAETERDGPLVANTSNTFLMPTRFSPLGGREAETRPLHRPAGNDRGFGSAGVPSDLSQRAESR